MLSRKEKIMKHEEKIILEPIDCEKLGFVKESEKMFSDVTVKFDDFLEFIKRSEGLETYREVIWFLNTRYGRGFVVKEKGQHILLELFKVLNRALRVREVSKIS